MPAPSVQVPGIDDGDICGDVKNNGSPDLNDLYLGQVTLNCNDVNNDGSLDVPIIVSWDNNASNNCSTASQAVPGTTSKCVRNDGFKIPVPIPGQLIVQKQTNFNNAAGSFGFSLVSTSANATFNLSDNGEWKSGENGHPVLFNGTYTITETAQANWSLSSVTCTSQD